MTIQYHVKCGSDVRVMNAREVSKLQKHHKKHLKVLFWTLLPEETSETLH